ATDNALQPSACNTFDGDGVFNQPAGLTVSASRLYVTNDGDDSIVSCALTPAGTIDDCLKTESDVALETPLDIAVNGGKAYVSNLVSHTLAVCDIEESGQVSNCAAG